MTYKLRFKYNGTWTRWYNENEDLEWIKGITCDEIEMTETMTYKEFVKRHRELFK